MHLTKQLRRLNEPLTHRRRIKTYSQIIFGSIINASLAAPEWTTSRWGSSEGSRDHSYKPCPLTLRAFLHTIPFQRQEKAWFPRRKPMMTPKSENLDYGNAHSRNEHPSWWQHDSNLNLISSACRSEVDEIHGQIMRKRGCS